VKPYLKECMQSHLNTTVFYSSVTAAIITSLTPQSLISHEWSGGNSCFFDVGLALWFKAFNRWPQQASDALLKLLPSHTVLASIFNHYEQRNKWLATGHGDLADGQRELSLGQSDPPQHIPPFEFI